MSQDSKIAAQMERLNSIHSVEGFDPSLFAVEYNDLISGEKRKRLPVMMQIAWFRLKYPEGKIALETQQAQGCFVATARVYPSYKDARESYLAEATASRGPDPTKPSVSPREWAQTAAVGIALRNAGFGVQFHAAGDDFPTEAPNEFGGNAGESQTGFTAEMPSETAQQMQPEPPKPVWHPAIPVPLTPEQQYQQDLTVLCPISKYSNMTLGEVMEIDPKALIWVANKYDKDAAVSDAAKRICEFAKQQASA